MARLTIPDDAECIVPGCTLKPEMSLSIRLRYEDTSAAWAPEAHAYTCRKHGENGADLELKYSPRLDGALNISVMGVSRSRQRFRAYRIRS